MPKFFRRCKALQQVAATRRAVLQWNIRKWASGHPCKGWCQRRTECQQCRLQWKEDSHQIAHDAKITEGWVPPAVPEAASLSGEASHGVLVRHRTGHNRLNSHMHDKLKLASSPTCTCDQADQTTEHVLQRCPLHKATREDVWPVSTPLTTKLYGCKQELEKTTSFISRAAFWSCSRRMPRRRAPTSLVLMQLW